MRDAEGQTGRVGPLVENIAGNAVSGIGIDLEPLIAILLIPRVLCSAAPSVNAPAVRRKSRSVGANAPNSSDQFAIAYHP